MQLSTMTNIHQIYQDDESFFTTVQCIDACAQAGYRVMDMSLSGITQPGRYLYLREAQLPWLEEVIDALDQNHVRFLQCHGVFYGTKLDQKSEDFSMFIENIKNNLWLASKLSIPWMVLHPLSCQQYEEHEVQEIMKENVVFFRSLYELSEKFGVGIAIENMITGPFQSAERLLELLDGINHPASFGVCWDTGHANLTKQNQAESIYLLGSKLKTTHIADNRGIVDDHLLPFSGIIEWRSLVSAMKKIEYSGAFSFEAHNATRNYPLELRKEVLHLSYLIGKNLLEG
ncbi:sugar phosphate isomerase/epimerase [Sphaerochaeta sp.]|jgi:sugar phosphate isomerase/epimerase|uniref:sugar phosphate isomerase/epimerase family protein n=1 Tax=Sphaerochaeta sp. TaxID=1972642 RepID=UPI002A359F51|nr:sugar phosphate isomerase/epimerase [Sphaerochaeta sp.]MDX9985144.1 sugar phosphate isomerase/epimerase [Sphaerochaeta sp.]